MQNHETHSINNAPDFSAVSLISVYNTHVYDKYRHHLDEEPLDMHCLLFSLEGNGKIILRNGNEIPLAEKTILLSRLSSVGTICSDCKHWHYATFWFIPHNIKPPVDRTCFIKDMDVKKENENAEKTIRLLQMKLKNKIQYANSLFCARLMELLEGLDPVTQKNTTLVDGIIDFINQHIEERLLIKDIANAFYYSEKHIRSVFNNTLHISPKQYIAKTKLEHVYYLLTHSDVSVEYLAEKYCFASPSHLINSFKKEYGMSPSGFRKRN